MSWLLFTFCLLAPAQATFVPRLYPIDDTSRDPTFRTFVKHLRSAVEARNTPALRRLVDKAVVVGPEKDDTGWTKFEQRWRPDAEDSDLWSVLSTMLSLGFVREHPSLFLSPYVVWRFPDGLDRATHLVVIRDKVSLRMAPTVLATEIASLSFEVVEQLGPPAAGAGLGEWVRVRTAEGRNGYLNTRDVMSPLMARAQFGKPRGKWTLVALEGPG